jgi:hypothetical protein
LALSLEDETLQVSRGSHKRDDGAGAAYPWHSNGWVPYALRENQNTNMKGQIGILDAEVDECVSVSVQLCQIECGDCSGVAQLGVRAVRCGIDECVYERSTFLRQTRESQVTANSLRCSPLHVPKSRWVAEVALKQLGRSPRRRKKGSFVGLV